MAGCLPVDVQGDLRGNEGGGGESDTFPSVHCIPWLAEPRSSPIEGCLVDTQNVFGVTILEGPPLRNDRLF